MNKDIFTTYKKWYDGYYDSFKNCEPEVYRNIVLKYKHTMNVCGNITEIAHNLKLDENDIIISRIVALFHDLGRFEQFKKYKTFSDEKSVNHAALALEILEKYELLKGIEPDTKKMICDAIKNHNSVGIEENIGEKSKLFAKLIRDADKLDIFRIFVEYYESPDKDESVALHLKDNENYTPELIDDILSGKTIRYGKLKFMNDFKLLKISWLFDINFSYSFDKILENNYINMIYDKLPKDENTKKVFDKARIYLLDKCSFKN